MPASFSSDLTFCPLYVFTLVLPHVVSDLSFLFVYVGVEEAGVTRYQDQAEAMWHIISPHPKIQNITYIRRESNRGAL